MVKSGRYLQGHVVGLNSTCCPLTLRWKGPGIVRGTERVMIKVQDAEFQVIQSHAVRQAEASLSPLAVCDT